MVPTDEAAMTCCILDRLGDGLLVLFMRLKYELIFARCNFFLQLANKRFLIGIQDLITHESVHLGLNGNAMTYPFQIRSLEQYHQDYATA